MRFLVSGAEEDDPWRQQRVGPLAETLAYFLELSQHAEEVTEAEYRSALWCLSRFCRWTDGRPSAPLPLIHAPCGPDCRARLRRLFAVFGLGPLGPREAEPGAVPEDGCRPLQLATAVNRTAAGLCFQGRLSACRRDTLRRATEGLRAVEERCPRPHAHGPLCFPETARTLALMGFTAGVPPPLYESRPSPATADRRPAAPGPDRRPGRPVVRVAPYRTDG
ncbi:hypothetical protein QKG26_gp025 [Chelonid alphaherpesvirus 5]|uniref:Uncharacterized protein n=1 Tax=Chelonid alphaherpesvirus 5 TaxID=702736 RepID=V5NYM4_9ALPH|nr:hypothetical protein QKG26_gp006 [Chelonid alphaherpesvirus 5]YP_010795498.1 hypothetical protein QKG26_gp025 [Chelonid alphaherpesvirus 5]AHA93293.1 hypothetical protein [Chelonid alphaherpesvirus 5]AHA93312.1 hypothetical protein [Chelonid alphaherpesvirus 5]